MADSLVVGTETAVDHLLCIFVIFAFIYSLETGCDDGDDAMKD